MNKEDLRLRSWYGEGYHSGASKTEVLAYDINDEELLEKECDIFNAEERYLGELDGKHSEVYGERDTDDNEFFRIIEAYEEADTDVFEDEFYSEKDSDVYRALKKAHDFVVKFKIKEVYRHKGTGEILNMDNYVKDYDIIEVK